MNIVIISPILPYPLSSGGAQAQFNMIDKLRSQHRITFIFPENGSNSLSAMRRLRTLWPEVDFHVYHYATQLANPSFAWSKFQRAFNLQFRAKNISFQQDRILKPYGHSLDAMFVHFVRRIIRRAKADVIEVDFYQFLDVVEFLPKEIPCVFVHHELRFVRNERLLANFAQTSVLQSRKEAVKEHEISQLNKYNEVVTLTPTDRHVLVENGVKCPVVVSPAAINASVMPYEGWNGNVSFLGGYSHFPNQEGMEWFLGEVTGHLSSEQKAMFHFQVIGGGWPQQYDHMGQLQTQRLGFVEKLSDALRGTILIVPILSGSGMRMKILEAAAMGVPFVTTAVGVEGLQFRHMEECLIADSAEDFAKALVSLMTNAELRLRLADAASKVYREEYSVDALAAKRERILASLAKH